MYIPRHFAQPDLEQALSFMQQHSFACWIRSLTSGLQGVHLPFVMEQAEPDALPVLYTHLALANPIAQEDSEDESLVIFSGPHAYISPSLYDTKQAVPTWNYVAVHAYGNAAWIHEQPERVALMESMIRAFEPAYLEQWNALNPTYREQMLAHTRSLRFTVTRLEGKEKLSQNKSLPVQQRISKHLIANTSDPYAQETGRRMAERIHPNGNDARLGE